MSIWEKASKRASKEREMVNVKGHLKVLSLLTNAK